MAKSYTAVSHHGEQRCPNCREERREPSSLQLAKPLVYVSCCVQLKNHAASKRFVEALYDSIETFFEGVCFPPAASHSRKAHLPPIDDKLLPELQGRMRQSCCVFVCLSDSYPMSRSQLRILRDAILARKSIIPVLLPAVGGHRAGAEQEASPSPSVCARASAKWRRHPADPLGAGGLGRRDLVETPLGSPRGAVQGQPARSLEREGAREDEGAAYQIQESAEDAAEEGRPRLSVAAPA